MKKVLMVMFLFLCSFTWLSCKVTIVNNSDKELVLKLKYGNSFDSHNLAVNASLDFNLKKNNKSLVLIKVYDKSNTELQSISATQIPTDKDSSYLIIGDGSAWAAAGAAAP